VSASLGCTASAWLALPLALVGLAGCGEQAPGPSGRAPRVVLVSIDTLNVDWTGAYNPEVTTTPALDRIAADGVRFARAYTEVPITLPSHAALLTGVSARRLGVLANGEEVPDTARTLAEILGERGYRTGAFVSLGVLRPSFHLDQGFEDYPDPFDAGPPRWYRTADEVLAPAERFLREHAAEPFFLWVHFSDPHEPYLPVGAPPDTELYVDGELEGRFTLQAAERERVSLTLGPGRHVLRWTSLRAPRPDDRPETAIMLELLAPPELASTSAAPLVPSQEREVVVPEGGEPLELAFTGYLERPTPEDVLPSYEREVSYADAHLAELDALLASLGLRDETLLVVVSDHGEGLFRHDFLGHATAVYEDQLRVLWLMRGPGVAATSTTSDVPALLVDVAPTILELLGLSSEARGMDGRSRVGCWTGGVCPAPEPWWAFALDHERGRLTEMAGYRWPFKWIWRRGLTRSGYDLLADPQEGNDLLLRAGPDNPEPLKRAAESFRDVHRGLAETLRRRERERSSGENEDVLRSLGYLGGRKP
jgi:arylsulfatase A-like enzyme